MFSILNDGRIFEPSGSSLNPCCDGMFSIMTQFPIPKEVIVLILVVMGCFLFSTMRCGGSSRIRLNPCCDGMFSIHKTDCV